jgi:hypothetical protein
MHVSLSPMTDTRIRLFGIDAPEVAQTCNRGGTSWTCGSEASAFLAGLVREGQVTCHQRDIDVYGRIVATCRVGYVDLRRAMIDAGLAVTLPQAPADYLDSEARRRERKLGLWASQFDMPSAYRAAHPSSEARPAPKRYEAPRYDSRLLSQGRPSSSQGGTFRNCAQAWAMGLAPVYRGSPGYLGPSHGQRPV